jgi:hypothetical protein
LPYSAKSPAINRETRVREILAICYHKIIA